MFEYDPDPQVMMDQALASATRIAALNVAAQVMTGPYARYAVTADEIISYARQLEGYLTG